MLYHLTRKNLGNIATLDPAFARKDIYDSGEGVSFAPSIESAYRALPDQVGPGNLGYGYKYKKYYVYVPVGKTSDFTRPETDDIDWIEERRSINKVQCRLKGKIVVTSENPFRYQWV